MPFVYLVRCADDTLYCGYAQELEARIAAHNAGKGAKYTAGRRPVTLVYAEQAEDRAQGQRREAALKKLTKAQKLALIQGWTRPNRP